MNTLPNLWMNLKFALRQLRRSPGFALTAVLTLALGIGANTAIFSFLDQALLRSLPVQDPQRLVVLQGTGKAWEGHQTSHGGPQEAYFSYPMYRDLRDHATAFQGLIATSPVSLQVGNQEAMQTASGELVSGNYFSVLGVQPHRGRLLTALDDQAAGANPVIVLSYDFWRDHLAHDEAVVGRDLKVNGQLFRVIGIAPPAFRSAVWGQQPALFAPMSMLAAAMPGQGGRLEEHKNRWLNIIGRLAPGVTSAQAQASIAPLWHALRQDELKALGKRSPRFIQQYVTDSRLLLTPGARGFSYERGSLETPLLVLMGMALLVLVIASVNVASLLLVRAAGRVREFSLRAALGAQSGRLVSQLLLEGLVIGVLGGAAGLLLAPLGLRALVHQLGGLDGMTAFTAELDGRLLLFNFVVALAVSLAFSLAPALTLRRPDLTGALREVNTTEAGRTAVLRRVVVGLQVGLSVVLLVGAGLFVKTMHNLRAVNLGFGAQQLITFGVTPRLAGYTPEQAAAVQQRALLALQQTPGITQAGSSNLLTLSGSTHGGNITVVGYTAPRDDGFDVEKDDVSLTFFDVMQVPLLAGRGLQASDDPQHPLVAVINETMAKQYFGSPAAALGRHFSEGNATPAEFDTEIVGVVRDFQQANLRDAVQPAVFRLLQQPAGKQAVRELHFYLRTSLPQEQAFAAARRTMQQVDAGLALDQLRTMNQQLDESVTNDRLVETLALAFGVLATVLAGVGLYGLLAYSTAQRTREIGIRMALGSSRLAVSQLILADVIKLVGCGLLLGLPAAYGLSGVLHSLLFNVSAADPAVLAGVVLLLGALAVLAALLPVRRAVSVNPNQALRAE